MAPLTQWQAAGVNFYFSQIFIECNTSDSHVLCSLASWAHCFCVTILPLVSVLTKVYVILWWFGLRSGWTLQGRRWTRRKEWEKVSWHFHDSGRFLIISPEIHQERHTERLLYTIMFLLHNLMCAFMSKSLFQYHLKITIKNNQKMWENEHCKKIEKPILSYKITHVFTRVILDEGGGERGKK